MLKNKRVLCVFFMAMALALTTELVLPKESYAYSFMNPTVLDPSNKICPSIPGFTLRIIVCIKESVIYAVYNFFGTFYSKLSDYVNALCIMAIAVWGTLVAMGKRTAPVKDGAVMFVKIGAVVMFTNNFGGLFEAFLDMMEYMLNVVTSYVIYSPSFDCPGLTSPPIAGTSLAVWLSIDCAIDVLIGGIFSPISIALGISGFLLAALFSQAIGLFVGLVGFLIIGQLLWAIIRGVYIFLSAYIAFALMVIISPLFIPLILFEATKGYFEKWLRITMGFMLQPIFLFTYLAMLMSAFDVVVYKGPNSLYHIIAGTAASSPSFKIGAWAYSNGIYGEASQSSQGINVNPKKTLARSMDDTNIAVMGTSDDSVDPSLGPNPGPTNLNVKVTEQITTPAEWVKANGLPKDILSQQLIGPLDYFRVDLPVEAIDWEQLASVNGYSTANLAPYWINLLLSCIMALLISYIFLQLLDLLPFIGSGVAGDVLSMPAFGTGPFAPPGDGAVMSMKNRLMGNIMGSR